MAQKFRNFLQISGMYVKKSSATNLFASKRKRGLPITIYTYGLLGDHLFKMASAALFRYCAVSAVQKCLYTFLMRSRSTGSLAILWYEYMVAI